MADGAVSAYALRKGDPDGLWPVPEWLQAFEGQDEYAWAIKGWRDAAKVEGTWFDSALADAIVADWPRWARLTTDRFAGVPFKLLPWQELIVRLLVGWQVPVEVKDPYTHEDTIEHVRLFRKLLLWIPRKNGKTEFLAALGLLFFTMDGLVGGEGYVFARNEDQAKKPFGAMISMAASSPDLQTDFLGYKRSLYSKELRASIVLLTGAEDGKHGKNASVILGDEMHEWKSRTIENTLRQSTGARLQPIELYASTAGRKSNLTGMGLWMESLAISEGRVFDPTTLVVMFAAPQEADYRDESAWRAANPSLGLSPTLAYLRREAANCADNPRAEMEFRCYHLNQWIDGEVRWLPAKKWTACAEDQAAWLRFPELFRNRKCFGAFDVSATQDITALVWVFPPTEDDPKWRCISRFWVPEETLAARILKDNSAGYDNFVRSGALETTPGDCVDQNYVAKAIKEGLTAFDVQKIGFDPWNATKLVTDLQADGVEAEKFVEMRQGTQTLGEPSKAFERLIFAGEFDHGGQPVLKWMAGHVVVKFDENLNFKPSKGKSADKIDGIVACVMAVGLALAPEEQEPETEIHVL